MFVVAITPLACASDDISSLKSNEMRSLARGESSPGLRSTPGDAGGVTLGSGSDLGLSRGVSLMKLLRLGGAGDLPIEHTGKLLVDDAAGMTLLGHASRLVKNLRRRQQ
ncbi:hypothetical protein THAOC_12136 [Thalassiosira oceanica]|uniref:Uncharacterized protein n=1 Tax=Thalassiosira oceanica TaxID=159749 RepID=K0SNE2_THAOC|nr:hypothetical protein THAOC_12136 [Thalassiosira oceanica]|eukprot:EJK66895.1 hypothetical protein THAOC_12136 [Thalassiosira oceanica]